MKSDRLLSLTLYLINRKKATARELAEYFEVSVRTIQRDMEVLEPSHAKERLKALIRLMADIYADR